MTPIEILSVHLLRERERERERESAAGDRLLPFLLLLAKPKLSPTFFFLLRTLFFNLQSLSPLIFTVDKIVIIILIIL